MPKFLKVLSENLILNPNRKNLSDIQDKIIFILSEDVISETETEYTLLFGNSIGNLWQNRSFPDIQYKLRIMLNGSKITRHLFKNEVKFY